MEMTIGWRIVCAVGYIAGSITALMKDDMVSYTVFAAGLWFSILWPRQSPLPSDLEG
jgi:hypothetical protein